MITVSKVLEIIIAYSSQQVLFQLKYITAWPVTNMMKKPRDLLKCKQFESNTDTKSKQLLSYWNTSSCIPNGQYYMIDMDNNPNSTVKNKKVKFSQCMTLKHIREWRYITLAQDGGEWSTSHPIHFTPEKNPISF